MNNLLYISLLISTMTYKSRADLRNPNTDLKGIIEVIIYLCSLDFFNFHLHFMPAHQNWCRLMGIAPFSSPLFIFFLHIFNIFSIWGVWFAFLFLVAILLLQMRMQTDRFNSRKITLKLSDRADYFYMEKWSCKGDLFNRCPSQSAGSKRNWHCGW